MTPLKFTELMNELPDDMIETANRPHQKKKNLIIYIIPAAAACFSLVVALSFFLKGRQMTGDPDFTASVDPEISETAVSETFSDEKNVTDVSVTTDVPVTKKPVYGNTSPYTDLITEAENSTEITKSPAVEKTERATERNSGNEGTVKDSETEKSERETERQGERPVTEGSGQAPHAGDRPDNGDVTRAPVTAPDTADEPSPVMANQNTKPADQNTQPAVNVPGYEPEPAAPQETEPAPGAACQPACPPDAQSDPPGAADPNLPDYSPTVQADNDKKPGDVNLDGKVDKSDLTKLSEYLSDKRNPEGQAFRNADINADGNVDLTDLSLLRKLISENET